MSDSSPSSAPVPEPPPASGIARLPEPAQPGESTATQAPPSQTAAEEVLNPISADLRSLLTITGSKEGTSLSLQEIADHLKERGWAMLALFLAAPFPIPNIPGLSVPFGIAISFIGVGFMLRRKPWLPAFVMRTRLEYSTLQRVVPFAARLMERLESWTKPRLRFLVNAPMMTSFIGLGIVSGALFLALPLPLPLTNGPPALSIIFLVVGMLCRDGLMVIIGHILGVLSWAYLIFMIYFSAKLLPYLWKFWDWIKSLF